MSTKTRDEVMQLIIDKVKLIHLQPGAHGLFMKILLISTMTSRAIQMIFAIKLMSSNSDNLLVMANGAKTLGVMCQGLKVFALLHEAEFIGLLSGMEYFWYSEEVEKVYKQARLFAKAFLNFVYFAFFFIIILPIILGSYPFVADFPKFPHSFWVFAMLQCFQLTYDVIVVLATDCSFLCFCLFIYIQFKMLNKRLKNIGRNEHNIYEEAVICIQYHTFLLEFIRKFVKMFFTTLLNQYCITIVSFCIEIFVFTRQSLFNMMASSFYMAALLFQLSLYCFPADLVIEEGLMTSDAITNSNWYNFPKFSKLVVQNIIQRSNKKIVFSAGGLVQINRVAFTMIFKWALSLYALMRDMDNLMT